jgi:predicted transcriptional regulator
MQDDSHKSQFVELTAEIVSAYLSNSNVPAGELPTLISNVHAAFAGISKPAVVASEPPTPAVPVKKSITADYLISLEDGQRYKSLKRHLTGLGMTPDEYRAKWGLPPAYPMVSANYSKARSELAKKIGLGQKRAEAPAKSGKKSSTRAQKARPA